MGWTFTYIGYYEKDKKALMIKALEQSGYMKVIKASMRGNVFYAACETLRKPGHYWGIVCLTSLKNGEFGYKDIEEDMGPCYYDCPASILDMLSPTDNNYALEWRKQCRIVAKDDTAKRLNALPIGSVIEVNGRRFKKHKAAYQFKTPFWMDMEVWSYIPKTRIKQFTLIAEGQQ